ncbi:MAG: sugar ABC transporter permease, partial [Paracoccaceae bacterium]
FRWSFFEVSDVPVTVSIFAVSGFLVLCMAVIWFIFRTGWRLRE